MSSRACRIVLALSFLASAARTARAAPMVAVPLPPPPQGMALSSPAPRPFVVGAKVGLDSPLGNGADGAPVLEADIATPWRTTASGVALGWALELRTFLPSTTDRGGMRSGASGLEVTPTVRASVPVGRSSFAFRTQLGIGAVARATWAQVDTRFVGRQTVTGSEGTALVRAGLALDWAVRPRLSIAIEPLSLGFDLRGNADWIFGAGAAYRL